MNELTMYESDSGCLFDTPEAAAKDDNKRRIITKAKSLIGDRCDRHMPQEICIFEITNALSISPVSLMEFENALNRAIRLKDTLDKCGA